jgi:hypothetical protein
MPILDPTSVPLPASIFNPRGPSSPTTGAPGRSPYFAKADHDHPTQPTADQTIDLGASNRRYRNGYFQQLYLYPPASVTPVWNNQMSFQLTNDTTLVIKVKGNDGVVRSATLTLA